MINLRQTLATVFCCTRQYIFSALQDVGLYSNYSNLPMQHKSHNRQNVSKCPNITLLRKLGDGLDLACKPRFADLLLREWGERVKGYFLNLAKGFEKQPREFRLAVASLTPGNTLNINYRYSKLSEEFHRQLLRRTEREVLNLNSGIFLR